MANDRLSVGEGLSLIRREIGPIGTETVRVVGSLGRVLAGSAMAVRTVPGFRAAAMDGFVVRCADLATATPVTPVLMPITGSVAAGDRPPALPSGQAWRISTGACVPDGGDSVIMAEHARIDGSGSCPLLWMTASIRPGLNVREIGEDMVAGRAVLRAGAVVTPDVIAALTAYGIAEIAVHRAPCIALVTTGNELAAAGTGIEGATIIDSNAPMILAAARSLGVAIGSAQTVGDDPAAIDRAIDRACATACNLVVSTGGASHGEHDGIVAALARRGATLLFHGLAMRPGKPVVFARLADGRPFFGLPGNPVSACVAMRFFVTDAIRSMLGLAPERGWAVESAEACRPGVTMFVRGRLHQDADGRLRVDTAFDQRSHILSSLLEANCWLRVTATDGDGRHHAFPKIAVLDQAAIPPAAGRT